MILRHSPPYEGTSVKADKTRQQLDTMLREFVQTDARGNTVCKVIATQWTVTPEYPLGILQFGVELVENGQKRTLGFRETPKMLKRVRGQGYNRREVDDPDASMRLLYWYMKSKLEAVLWGLNDIVSEFLDDALYRDRNGNLITVGSTIALQLRKDELPKLEFLGVVG